MKYVLLFIYLFGVIDNIYSFLIIYWNLFKKISWSKLVILATSISILYNPFHGFFTEEGSFFIIAEFPELFEWPTQVACEELP